MAKKNKAAVIDSQSVPNLTFSFQYYDSSDENLFCLSYWNPDDIKYTLARLKEMCAKPILEMIGKKTYHFYPTNWSSTIFKSGFPESVKELNELEPFHFAIVGLNGQKARVFGALSGSTFYIAWFDYDHKILPTQLKHT